MFRQSDGENWFFSADDFDQVKRLKTLKNTNFLFKNPWPQVQVEGINCPSDGPFLVREYSTNECSDVFVVRGDDRGEGTETEEGTVNGKYRKERFSSMYTT